MKAKTCEDCCNLVSGMCIYNPMFPKPVVKLEPVGFKCPLEDFDKKKRENRELRLKDKEFKELLTGMYIGRKMSMREIATELDININKIKYAMEKFCITRRSHSELAKAQHERGGWWK